MRYFTVSAKGRKGHNFDYMGYMYQLDIDMFGKIEDFYIYADNRKAAIEISKVIVSTIKYDSTVKEVQNEVDKQNGLQQLKVAYRMLETHEDKEKVKDYIRRLKAHLNIETNVDTEEENTQHEAVCETSAQDTVNEQTKVTNDNNTYYTAYNRSFSTYNEAYNYCIQSDFDPEYIEAVSAPVSQNALQLDLQLFANPIDNNVSITNGIWIKGNYTVKYIVEHTKHDKDININYDNIIKFECKNLQHAHEIANLYKSHDYNNISICYTIYNANKEPIIEDYINDVSFIMSESEKRRISQIKQDNERLIKELELYKSFVAHYKSEKVFDQFKENINNKESA